MKKTIIALLGAIALTASSCCGELTTEHSIKNGVTCNVVRHWRYRWGTVYEVRQMYNHMEEEFPVPEASVSITGTSIYWLDCEYK